jgi:hypothetical protein
VEITQTADGQVTKTVNGEEVPPRPQSGVDKMQDPNAPVNSSEFARWASQFDHSKKKGAPVIIQVNPGPDGATPKPKGPHILVSHGQLAGNPSPESVQNGDRPMDAATSRRFGAALRNKVRPGGKPVPPGQ